ncbi:zinc-binding dehydrogenase [Paenibacillus sp. tmac-D7]|uniref:zinc-dependent alcohol dehydrogenase n=1 Tax=Paenibacillus sp. tmac-D7 TaxID=2591462 RepID=UPI0011433FF6|nr:alcohol dehydrogenase catalytic domain-containing protein [Paenibacillus sp. tmac-D7]
MAKQMVTAAVLTAPRTIKLEQFEKPRVNPENALVRVEACGLCGTDAEQYIGAIKSLNIQYPIIPGHEVVGIIEKIGKKAAERWGVKIGDRVVVDSLIPCRHCDNCTVGQFNLCSGWNKTMMGYSYVSCEVSPHLWGGYATHMYLHPNSLVRKIDKTVAAEKAVLFNALGGAIHWTYELPKLKYGDRVLVIAAGLRGVMCCMVAKAMGASQVILAGIQLDEQRLGKGLELGADHSIIVDKEDLVQRIRELTDGKGVDIVIDLSPHATESVIQALEVIAKNGTIVLLGLKNNAEIKGFVSDKLIMKACTIIGGHGVSYTAFKRAISMIEAGSLPLDKLQTKVFPLDEAHLAMATLAKEIKDDEVNSIVIMPALRG